MNIEIIHQDNESITLRAGKTEAHVALFCDEINVTCRNRSHLARGGPGRFFSTWDSAIDGYKSDAMKLAIATARDLLTGAVEGEQPDADMTPDEARDVLADRRPGDTATALWALGRSVAAEQAGRPRLPITTGTSDAQKSKALGGCLYGPDGLDESLWKMDEPYKPAPASLVGCCEKCGAKTDDLALEHGLYRCPTCRRHSTSEDRGPSALEAAFDDPAAAEQLKARLREIDEDHARQLAAPASDASKSDRVDVRPVQGEQAGRPGLDEPEGVEAGPLAPQAKSQASGATPRRRQRTASDLGTSGSVPGRTAGLPPGPGALKSGAGRLVEADDDLLAVADTCDECGQRHGPGDPECNGMDWKGEAIPSVSVAVAFVCLAILTAASFTPYRQDADTARKARHTAHVEGAIYDAEQGYEGDVRRGPDANDRRAARIQRAFHDER